MTEMNRYANGKIYMIESASAGLVYYGSTCLPLHKRFFAHKQNYGYFQKGKYHYVTSFKILDHEDNKIVLVEEFPCENKQQLLAREAYYIRTQNCVNKCVPNRTQEEHYEDNKEKRKQYREDHQENINEYQKQYYENNKEYFQNHSKQYYEDNKKELQDKRKKRYNDNKEKHQEIIHCECGSTHRIDNKHHHIKTIKHQSFINNKQ